MASEHDISLAAADIYAESLLELANERGVAEELFAEFESLVAYIHSDEGFAGFMTSSAVDDDDPSPPPFPDLGSPSLPLVPGLSLRGVAAVAILLAAIGGMVLAGRRCGKRVA